MSETRDSGYYICQTGYDFTRGIFWWDSSEKQFYSVKNQEAPTESFTFISKNPINLLSDDLEMDEVDHG